MKLEMVEPKVPVEPKARPASKAYALPFLRTSVERMVGKRRWLKLTKGRTVTGTKALKGVLVAGLKDIADGKDKEYATKRLADLRKAACYQRVAEQLGVVLVSKAVARKAKASAPKAKKAKKDWSKVAKVAA